MHLLHTPNKTQLPSECLSGQGFGSPNIRGTGRTRRKWTHPWMTMAPGHTSREFTHTHLSHAHFSARNALTAHIRTSSSVSHTRMAKCHEKGVCTCAVSPHLAFSLLMLHLSLLFPQGHFETTPDYDFTDDPIHMILPYFPVLKAQDMRHSAHASRSLATCPSQMQRQRKLGRPAGWCALVFVG